MVHERLATAGREIYVEGAMQRLDLDNFRFVVKDKRFGEVCCFFERDLLPRVAYAMGNRVVVIGQSEGDMEAVSDCRVRLFYDLSSID